MEIKYQKNQILLFACVILITLFQSCKQEKNFSVEVSFEVLDPTPVRLYLLSENSSLLVDSAYLDENTTVTLRGKAEYSSLYLVKYFNDQSIFLVIHPSDKIKLEINNAMDEISYYVKGSADSRLIKEISDNQNLVLKTIDQLSLVWEENRSDSALLKDIDSSYSALLKNHQKYTRDFIYANPNSLATILALYQNFGRKSQALFDRYDDLDIFNFVDSNLTILYPQTEAVKALNKEVTETKEQIAHNKYIEKRVAEGLPLPQFEAISLGGDTIIVDDNININILVLFWASWNSFSVDELLSLNEFYKESKTDKIKIITISIDSSEEKLRDFIQNNSIELPVVCDYKYWESELVGRYAIKRIPSVLLTNKAGIITAKDIFSDELIEKLKKIK